MRLVVDTNIIFSALIKESTTRRILISTRFDFYTPEYVFIEIQNHSEEIMEKSKYDHQEFETMTDSILSNIMVVPTEDFKDFIPRAFQIMKNIDEDDSSFLALALMINSDGIWSNDPHFEKQNEIKVWKTKDLINLL